MLRRGAGRVEQRDGAHAVLFVIEGNGKGLRGARWGGVVSQSYALEHGQ